jgi:predicted transcriptional regulator
MIIIRYAACLVLILGAIGGLSAASAAYKHDVERAASLIDFKIKDQFDTVHRSGDVAGFVVLLIGSDKDGSEFNALWGEAISDALRNHSHYDQLAQLPQADLRGVPFFVKGLVKSKMPENPQEWVLMDWKGALSKAYQFVPGSTNVLVFGPDGRLHHQSAGQDLDDVKVQAVVKALQELLNAL